MLKKTIIIIIYISSIVICFLIGLYLGTINNNYLAEKKNSTLNIKNTFLRKLSNKDYYVNNISIKLNSSDFRSLIKEQDYFSSQKWLDKKLANYYKCKITFNNNTLKGKIRNKGLLLKPWEYDEKYFSYKIKLKKGDINGLKKFYLNYPKKRNNLHEWYGDKIYKYYKLIYQKNSFVNLDINGQDKGLYLLEESFDYKLLNNNNRSSGPIIYYSKAEMIKSDNYDYGESFFKAEIKFQYPHKYNDSAKKLLNNFILKTYSANKVFDFEKTATHFALADLIGYYHQLNYHNVKFYYDTSKNMIEPIANDFQFYDIKKWTKESFGIVFKKQNNNPNYFDYFNAPWMKILFENNDFFSLYLKKLNDFSSKNKIDSLFNFLKPYEDSAFAIISKFDPFYSPKVKSIIKKNANHITQVLRKEPPLLVNQPKVDSDNNIIMEIKNSCYLPLKTIGIYQNDSLVISLNENSLIEGKNYGEAIKIQKMKFFMTKKISFDDSLQFKYQFFGERSINQVSFKFQVNYNP